METNHVPPVKSSSVPPRSLAPLSRGEIILGMLPFLLLGFVSILSEAPYTGLQAVRLLRFASILYLGLVPVFLLILLAGWLKGFPRWVFPYLVYAIVFAFHMSNSSTPGLTFFKLYMWGGELWGWRAWVPFGMIVILALLISRSTWKPLAQLIKNVWKDWSLLVFGLYAILTFAVSVFLDEMESSYSLPTAVISVILILIGAFLYLKLFNRRYAILGLLTCAFLALLSLGIGSELYWQTHYVTFTPYQRSLIKGPVPWTTILSKSLLVSTIFTMFLLVPGLVGITNWLVHRQIDKPA